jgi:hypothetical protein
MLPAVANDLSSGNWPLSPGGAVTGGPGNDIKGQIQDTWNTQATECISMSDDQTRTELEAAAFRRLVSHLRERTDVQNIDLMNLAGFCRNCLSNWYQDAAAEKDIAMTKDEAREIVYGMPYGEWKERYQREASSDQLAAFETNRLKDH